MNTTSPVWTRPNSRNRGLRSVLAYAVIAILLTNGISVHGQSTSDLKGESSKVNVLPNTTVDAKEIRLKSDRDHDGMPDEDEDNNGTDPDDASDADGDNDGDGIPNGDEFGMGTNLNAADSDGDGFSDADEIAQGFNPLDANSHPAPPASPGTYQVTRSEGATIVPGDTDTGNMADDGTTTIPLPFDYTLYNQTFSEASISSNGVLQFNGPIADSENTCLPYQYFSYAILPLWDNLRTDPVGAGVFTSISGSAPNRIFNIEWRAELFAGGETHFEVRLFEGQTRFDVIYGNLTGDSAGATIGVQKETGQDFTQYSCDGTNLVGPGTLLSFTLIPGAFPTPTPLVVTPNPVNIHVNSLLGQQPVQLQVTRANSDGSVTDLTNHPDTTYESSNPFVALVDDLGNVAGISAGSATVTAQNGSSTGDVPVNVTTLTAGLLGFVAIPGNANNVDVSGNRAYVAAGAAGLVVVTIDELANPKVRVAASLALPGNGNDVRIAGGKAYVAGGSAGLHIVDVSNPDLPTLLGSVDTTGDAQDVMVAGNRAYVADGEAGLQVIDVTDPAAPTILGSVVTSGTARGVDVSGNFVVVADDQPGALRIVDVTDPANPQITGSLAIDFQAKDVWVRDRFAYVSAELAGLLVVDFSDPARPQVVNGIPENGQQSFYPRDVKLHGRYGAVADRQYFSQVPIVDFADPTNPQTRGLINLFNFGIIRATGVAIDGQFVYSTMQPAFTFNENAANGTTWLYVSRYLQAETLPTDSAGIAPTVAIAMPNSGESFMEGSRITISATANDDVRVGGVRFSANGTDVITDTVAPYQISYIVPVDISSLTLGATAFDLAGNTAAATPVNLNVLPDPPPTISIVFPPEGATLTESQDIFLQVDANDNVSVQQVTFRANGEDRGQNSFYVVPTGINSLTIEATATDNLGRSTTATRTVTVIPDPPPTISITSPPAGTQLTERQTITLAADANDNINVSYVVFNVNGADLEPLFSPPYTRSTTVPVGSTLELVATVIDNLGQTAQDTRTYAVVPDPNTTVTGFVKDTAAQPIANATVTAFEFTAQTAPDGSFSIANVPTVRGDILARATATISSKAAANASLPTSPVTGGATDVGVITLSVAATAPSAFSVADYDGDFQPDVFVGYPDRQSLIYSFMSGQFSPSTSHLLPFGALSSGANLATNYGSDQDIFAQLSGRPGSVTVVPFTYGVMQATRTHTTGLAGESEYTAVAFDNPEPPPVDSVSDLGGKNSKNSKTLQSLTSSGSELAVLAFLHNGSGGTSLTVRFGDDSPEGFADPVVVPVESSVPLRSLVLDDINHDGLMDLLLIKPVTGTDAKLVVYLRTSESTFGNPIETPVTVRATVPAHGAIDFVIGKFAGSFSQTDIAVLSDDRVRIYQGDGAGGFTLGQQILVPAGQLVTGVSTADLTNDGRSDLIVTTSAVAAPQSRSALAYFNTFSGTFQSPVVKTYTAPVAAGDTRVGAARWGGSFNRLDLVVADGEVVIILLDVGPFISSS